jgi:hypothetical protein
MWSSFDHRCRARVAWYDCCAARRLGGLDLVDLDDALLVLSTKWLIKALTPGNSNLQYLLQFKLLQVYLAGKGGWPSHIQWALVNKFTTRKGSRARDKITQSWRRLVPHIQFFSSNNGDEVLSTNLWWTTSYVGMHFGFSRARAATLMRRGMH